jgi:hypothetical protein
VDGVAISYAVLEHLVTVNRSRTLFATHYHDLARLMDYDDNALEEVEGEMVRGRAHGKWKGVEFWCSDVEELSVR